MREDEADPIEELKKPEREDEDHSERPKTQLYTEDPYSFSKCNPRLGLLRKVKRDDGSEMRFLKSGGIKQKLSFNFLSLGNIMSKVLNFAHDAGRNLEVQQVKLPFPIKVEDKEFEQLVSKYQLKGLHVPYNSPFTNEGAFKETLDKALSTISYRVIDGIHAPSTRGDYSFVKDPKAKPKVKKHGKTKIKTFKLQPKCMVIESVLYLGCNRISNFAYSEPIPISGKEQNLRFQPPVQFKNV